MYEDRRQNCDK